MMAPALLEAKEVGIGWKLDVSPVHSHDLTLMRGRNGSSRWGRRRRGGGVLGGFHVHRRLGKSASFI